MAPQEIDKRPKEDRLVQQVSLLLSAKKAFLTERFASVLDSAAPLLAEDSPFRDEANYLIAHVHFITARRAADAGEPDRAIKHLRLCLQHAAVSPYADADIRTDARLLLRALEKQASS